MTTTPAAHVPVPASVAGCSPDDENAATPSDVLAARGPFPPGGQVRFEAPQASALPRYAGRVCAP
ncbi:hypothetical protein [Streptomyces agglomeratus]|uniref:hypothetical protein n=1 Tax=Streptomyces agglomeratus TaxID=285458 RepID=UPI00114CC792|nr:hypothetical protein [Streptomyces agglomeratus]